MRVYSSRRRGLVVALVAAISASVTTAFLPLSARPLSSSSFVISSSSRSAPFASKQQLQQQVPSSSRRPLFSLLESYEDEAPKGEVAEDGVSLRELQDAEGDSTYLVDQVTEWLDQEWIPQECHRDVAKVAAKAYVDAREEGVHDLGGVLLAVGTELEGTDMGDAFVDAWTVANKVSDLLLMRMGREVCCPTPEFTEEQRLLMTEGRGERELLAAGIVSSRSVSSDGESMYESDALSVLSLGGAITGSSLMKEGDVPQLLNPLPPPAFFTMEAVLKAAEHYLDEFNRFDFIRKFMDGHDTAWEEANVVMAIILGFKFDEWGNVCVANVNERFKHLPFPPDFRENVEMREALEAILREDEDEDKMKGLEEFLEVMVGKAYYHQMDKGENVDFGCRATLIKWVYEHDFVNEWPNLPTVQAVLEVKNRIQEKQDESKPPPRYLY